MKSSRDSSGRRIINEWPALMVLHVILAAVLFVQARRAEALWQSNRGELSELLTQRDITLNRHDHIFRMMSDLIALAATNAEAARIVRQYNIAITDGTPADAPPNAVSAPSLVP